MANISNVLNFHQDLQKNYNPSFRAQYKPNKALGRFWDIKRNLPGLNNTFSFLVCATSVVGFGVGGPALIYDHYYKKNHPKENQDQKQMEYGHFESATKIGKIGLRMNQMALVISGLGGATTGFAVGIPLMAVGEFIGNVIAAPLINTPIGYGLMNIGLAAIFGGRAFDTDPSHQAKMSMFLSKKTAGEKIGYVANNMKHCIADAAKASGHAFHSLVNLLNPAKEKRQAAIDFFRYKVIRVRSSAMRVVQNVNAQGMITKVESKYKSHPQVLLIASSILGLGAVAVITTDILKRMGILKSDKATKASFGIAKTGQVFDNYGIVGYGMQRCYMGNVVAGVPTVISGATMIAGAPNADNDFGKGLTWFGLAWFFLFLAAERGQGFAEFMRGLRGLKKGGLINEASVFARQFEIDLSKVVPKKHLKNFRNIMEEKTEDSYVAIRKALWGDKDKAVTDYNTAQGNLKIAARKALTEDKDEVVKRIPEFVDFLKTTLSEGRYNPEHNVDWLKKEILHRFPNQPQFADSIISKEVSQEAAIREAIYSNMLKSGKHYAPELDKLIASKDPVVSKVAESCKNDYKKLLDVE